MSDAQPVSGAESLLRTADPTEPGTSDASKQQQTLPSTTAAPGRTLLSQSQSPAPHYRRSLFRQ